MKPCRVVLAPGRAEVLRVRRPATSLCAHSTWTRPSPAVFPNRRIQTVKSRHFSGRSVPTGAIGVELCACAASSGRRRFLSPARQSATATSRLRVRPSSPRWPNRFGECCGNLLRDRIRDFDVSNLEVDEVWTSGKEKEVRVQDGDPYAGDF